MENEKWETLRINDNYEVSNLGKVRNKKTGRILKPGYNQSGHAQVVISGKSVLLHKLVMDAFDPITSGERYFLTDIMHINKDNADCRFENLKRCTHSENQYNRNYNTSKGLNIKYIVNRVRALMNKYTDEEVEIITKKLITTNILYLEF